MASSPNTNGLEKSMFDFSNILEKMTGFIGDSGAMHETTGGHLTDILGNADIDPSLLENIPLDQVYELLASAGIDRSTLSEGQIAELLPQLTGSGGE